MKILILVLVSFFEVSVYSFKVPAASGAVIDFSSFQGKKILVVNFACSSPMAEQIGELEQLYRQHKDSLVVIAFPSNSFGNEPRTNDQIRDFCTGMYNTSFLIASKGSVIGTDIQPFYSWITQQSQNGMLNSTVNGDFKKYLISKEGKLIGVFSSKVKPTDQKIQQALQY